MNESSKNRFFAKRQKDVWTRPYCVAGILRLREEGNKLIGDMSISLLAAADHSIHTSPRYVPLDSSLSSLRSTTSMFCHFSVVHYTDVEYPY
jgi:hypothetical protein